MTEGCLGSFWHPGGQRIWRIARPLGGRKDECLVIMPVLVCHDEVVVECEEDRGEETKRWLEKAMIEGMAAVINGTDEVHVPAEVEARIARSWGEGS